MFSASVEAVRLVMASFPSLTKIDWRCSGENDFVPISTAGVISSYPNIKSFELYDNGDHGLDVELISVLMKACPSLTELKFNGSCQVVKEVITSCRSLTSLSVDNFSEEGDEAVVPLLSAMASHGSQLKELSLHIAVTMIDIRDVSTRYALSTVIKRLRSLDIGMQRFLSDANDPDTALCSLFCSPGVDLRSLTISTDNEDANLIARMLLGCRSADTLRLRGEANIVKVMMKIADNCRHLVKLSLTYRGSVSDKAMKALLQ
jgi:hypothetical protein